MEQQWIKGYYYDDETDEILYLRLVKCEGAIGRFKGIELQSFCLGNDCNNNGVKCKSIKIFISKICYAFTIIW